MVDSPSSSSPATALWAAAALFLGAGGLAAQVVINEVDADNPGTDTLEFVELFDGGAGNTSLDGMVLVFFNGNGDASYRTVDLAGKSTNSDGLFVAGGDAVAGNYGIEVGIKLDPDDNVDNLIQNGADAVALLSGTADDFPDGTSVDDAVVTNNIIDALVYGTNDGEDFDLVDALLLAGEFQVDEGQNGNKDNESNQRFPDGGTPRSTSSYTTKLPTPGALNNPSDSLSLSATTSSFSEGAGAAASTGTLTRTGSTTAAVTVTLSLRNAESQVDRTELQVPLEVEIPAGASSAQFDIDAVDDLWPDGSQVISIGASGPGYQDADALEVTVQDSGSDSFLIAINEFYPTVGLDANGDGEEIIENPNSGGPNPDEFIEFVNPGATPLDISGWSITDLFIDQRPGFRPTHTFADGTVLDPGCAIVVFGSGIPTEGLNPNFGDAIVNNASGGQALFLNATDRISLRNADGLEVAMVSYQDQDGFDGSSTLVTEGDQSSGYRGHFVAFASDFSPGTMGDGTPFCLAESSLAIASTSTTISEDAGAAAATLTITRSPGTTGDLQVGLESSDTSELDVQAFVTIPDGSASVQVPLNAVDDLGPDGTQTVVITAQSPGFTPGTIEIQVTDDGDTAPTNLVINEIDADQDGTDDAEFIELYNPNASPASLDGFTIVLYNGNQGGAEYNVIPLTGSIPANGFFVVGGPDLVPSADLVPASFGTSNNIQNGADAVALFVGAPAAEFDGTDADPFSYPPNAVLVDAIVYGTSDAEDTFLVDSLTPGGSQIDEGPTNNSNSVSRSPDGSDIFAQLPPSPGAPNGAAPTGFDGWAAGNGLPGLGRFDDSDRDSLAAVVEYVLGLDPNVADADSLPSLVQSGADYTITFQLGAEASADGSVTPLIQVSGDLVTWTTLDSTNDGSTISATVPGDSGNLNVRLLVLQAIP